MTQFEDANIYEISCLRRYRQSNLTQLLLFFAPIKNSFGKIKVMSLRSNFMRWTSQKNKEGIFCTAYFVQREVFENLCFISIYEYTSRVYILLHIKKHYFIQFYCLFLKSSKAFNVSLRLYFTINCREK